MTTDYRALCAELLEELENAIRVIYHEDGTKHISTADAVIAKADAALAQPEPVGPTDVELDDLECSMWVATGVVEQGQAEEVPPTYRAFARAALARWGRPTITPIPVSERLPGPEDCDAEETCWMWHPVNFHYCLCRPDPSVHTHWLPFHALSLPGQPAPTAPAP